MKVHLHTESDKFRIKRRVRQGNTISPNCFTATVESIFRRLNWENKSVKIDGTFLTNLRFADDISLCTEAPQYIQHNVFILSEQYGFMPAKSTKDALFALGVLIEKYREGQKELHCVFVDLEKAYDKVPREEVWYCMIKSGLA